MGLQWNGSSGPVLDSSRQIPSDTDDFLYWPTSLPEEDSKTVTTDLKIQGVFGRVTLMPEKKGNTVGCSV